MSEYQSYNIQSIHWEIYNSPYYSYLSFLGVADDG